MSNPYFNETNFTNLDENGSFHVSFKIAGLKENVNIPVTASTYATTEYICTNNSENDSSNLEKHKVSQPVSTSRKFNSGNNGEITGDLILALSPLPTIKCPPGSSNNLVKVTYENIQISMPGSATEIIPGIFSRTFLMN